MRLYIKLNSSKKPVPFNYQPQLTGAIHKWLGENELHDRTSMYSFSWLQSGRSQKDHLVFEYGSSFHISAHNNDFIKMLIKGIQMDPTLNWGMAVTDILINDTPVFREKETFYPSSPILVKRTEGEKEIHYTYENENSGLFLTQTLQTKLNRAGLPAENIRVNFIKDHPEAKTKLIHYNRIGNKVSFCPVIIEGTPDQIAFAWNVGIGNSTGIGFGSLK